MINVYIITGLSNVGMPTYAYFIFLFELLLFINLLAKKLLCNMRYGESRYRAINSMMNAVSMFTAAAV